MLAIEGLTKRFGKLTAVDNLSLHVEPGDIMGFIGPNGAGKTTTIRIAATLLKPDSGRVCIEDIDVVKDPEAVRPLIGFMPDFFGLYEDVLVWEYLDFFASAYHIPPHKRRRLIDDVLELTDLTTKRDSLVSELSRGMQQRLCLAKTLVHDPKLLLLDEPASGLDPRARIEIKELLKELRRMGKTILISSHILPELADLCNKITIIEQGRLVVSGDVETIMNQCRGGKVLSIGIIDRHEEALAFLEKLGTLCDVKCTDGLITAKYVGDPDEDYMVLTALTTNGFKVRSFTEQPLDLEDVFMKVTRGAVA
ncbi:MAG: ABC transporter ATP-binding protein [Armatimonadota bacterium]|nr:ABC transporter ATP-binding protein [Armatimonadota bacterium]